MDTMSSVGYYCSYYGKKLDPKPGRCRVTDGKKWWCSNGTHTGSKYCERHLHHNQNRSRKPVESKSNSEPQGESHSSSSTLTSNVGSGSGSFQNITLQSTIKWPLFEFFRFFSAATGC